MRRFPKPPKFWLTLLVPVSFACALAWAAATDPFARLRFTLPAAGGKVEGMVVLTKPVARRPVVIYLHDTRESLQQSGSHLRQLAELGMAAVAMDYDQTNQAGFEAAFTALLATIGKQDWADMNAVSWFGLGLGAQRALTYLATHPQFEPRHFVWLAGGGFTGMDEMRKEISSLKSSGCQFFFVRGWEEETAAVRAGEELAAILRSQGNPVGISALNGRQSQSSKSRDELYRAIAEHIAGQHGISGKASERGHRYFWLPALVMLGWLCWWAGQRIANWCIPVGTRFSACASAFYVVVAIITLIAAAQTTLFLLLPRLAITPKVIAAARKVMVRPELRDDFEHLTADSDWHGRPLWQLFQHIELARLQRAQFYDDLDEAMYRDFVLSPRISADEPQEWGWRRRLWESFYPRVRKEDDPMLAAQTVARFLRERVGIDERTESRIGVETSWTFGFTDRTGFAGIHAAALRSVGIATKLDDQGGVQLWTGTKWVDAPQPMMGTKLQFRSPAAE